MLPSEVISNAEKIVVLTGAGISTGSGISDFRGPNGLWTQNPEAEKLSTLHTWRSREKIRREGWVDYVQRFHSGKYKPNAAHNAVTELCKAGRVTKVVTQNVDMLHEASGTPSELIYHVHGDLSHMKCTRKGCKHEELEADFLKRLKNDPDPACLKCRKPMKPGFIMFGEALDHEAFETARQDFHRADLAIVIGSSLTVFPASDLPNFTLGGRGQLMIFNNQPTDLDRFATVFREPCQEILPALIAEAGI